MRKQFFLLLLGTLAAVALGRAELLQADLSIFGMD
jgi:hypothetical protein